MSEKEKNLTAGEIREGLANVLKERLTKFEKNLEELSKKEALAKAELEAQEKLQKVTPPGVSEELMHKLKREYGGDKEKAYATAWKIHGEQKSKHMKKNATQGYGAGDAMGGAGGGFPGQQQQGQGMNKAELCKDCGKMHKEGMKKCSTDDIKPEVSMSKEELNKIAGATHALRAAGVPSVPKPTMPKAPTAGTAMKAEGVAGYPLKGQSKKSEDYINRKDSANPKARTKTIGKEGTLPGTKPSKKIEAEGSGGQIKKSESLAKAHVVGDAPVNMPSPKGKPQIPVQTRAKPIIPGLSAAAGIRGAVPKIPGRSAAGIRGAVPKLANPLPVNPLATAPTIPAIPAKQRPMPMPTAPTVPDMAAPIPSYQRKIGADEILAARASQGKVAQATGGIPGKAPSNELAADKKAGGVGFLNNLIAKFKGAGNTQWGQVATAPSTAKTGSRIAGAMGALARAEKDATKPGREPTPTETAFGNKTSMTAEATAPKPGEPAKSMYQKK